MKIDLSGKTALVTGSTAGIGHAIAKGLAGPGADVAINGRGQDKVDAAVKQLQGAGAKGRGIAARPRVIVADHPARAIVEEAKASGAGMIALETHGRAGLKRLVMGSIADEVIRAATVPVLLHRRE